MVKLIRSRKRVYEPQSPQEEFIVPLLKHCVFQILLEKIQPNGAYSRVLDVGCGGQPFRDELEKMGYQYYSLDIQQNLEETVNFEGRIDQSLTPELLDASPFDLVFCTEVMEHVAEWDVAFRNFSKILSDNGKLLITCPNFYPLHEEPFDFWRPTKYSLKYFGEKYGLRVLYQENAGTGWDVLGTFLATSTFSSISNNLLDRLLNKIFWQAHRLLFKSLKTRSIQKRIRCNSPFYLSNVVLFDKIPIL